MKRMLLMTAAILTHLYYFFKHHLVRTKHKKLLALLGTMKVLTPGQLIAKFKEMKLETALQLCKAKIYASQPCNSVLRPNMRVVYSSLFQGQFKSSPSKNALLRITEPSFMELKDEAESIKLFETHSSVIFPTKLIRFKAYSLWRRLIATIKSIFSRPQGSEKLKFNDFYSHDNVYELFLPEGTECTVLGKFSKEGKEIICSNPKMIFLNSKQMIAFIDQSIKNLNFVNIIMAVSLLFFTIAFFKEVYKFVKNYKTFPQERASFLNVRKIFQKSRVCTICKTNLSCIYNKKCKHMVVCQECQVKPASACLECNQKESDLVEMYVC